ncbi:MAG: UDP-N-acetylglucosamine 2-epimerase (non-hydrolyzing) [Xanthomonadales bacterium]|nr:UDP-N-acetylglucosamine 2-epimerase (non-hydrolyzing) [Xanthomonadales bacterium]
MITCIIGTRAQLIKMAPVIRELEARELKFQILLTGQHKETINTILNDFDIKTEPIELEKPKEVSSVFRMMFWFPRAFVKMIKHRKKLFEDNSESSWILVHGDTLSTLLGALVGKFTSNRIAHIESGLRSFSFFSPFPEEITRVLTFRLSDVGFCPGKWAVKNLKKYHIKAVDTQLNTIVDAVNYAISKKFECQKQEEHEYAVVSIHRFENIYRKKRFRSILDILNLISKKIKLVFVLHPTTKKRLNKYGWMNDLESNSNITLEPRMGYMGFIRLLSNSKFVITDGGSNQEELAYLGIPTLIMRDATERPEGLGETAIMNGFDKKIAEKFVADLEGLEDNAKKRTLRSPSKIIVDFLIDT